MNTLHGESWKYSTRTVQSRGIKLCFTYNHLHTVSIYHVEAIRKWSYVNSNYCSHRQWKSADYFLSFIATQKEKPLLLPNLSSFGWVCRRYFKLQYIEIMVEKKCRMSAPKSLCAAQAYLYMYKKVTADTFSTTILTRPMKAISVVLESSRQALSIKRAISLIGRLVYKSIRSKTGLESDRQLEIRLYSQTFKVKAEVKIIKINNMWQPLKSSLEAESIGTIINISISIVKIGKWQTELHGLAMVPPSQKSSLQLQSTSSRQLATLKFKPTLRWKHFFLSASSKQLTQTHQTLRWRTTP